VALPVLLNTRANPFNAQLGLDAVLSTTDGDRCEVFGTVDCTSLATISLVSGGQVHKEAALVVFVADQPIVDVALLRLLLLLVDQVRFALAEATVFRGRATIRLGRELRSRAALLPALRCKGTSREAQQQEYGKEPSHLRGCHGLLCRAERALRFAWERCGRRRQW